VTRRSLIALAAAVASLSLATLVIAVSPAAPGMTHTSAAGVPGCATRNLVVWLDTNGDAAAGSVHYELQFTNLSSRSDRAVLLPDHRDEFAGDSDL
jgi:hypothetical protein